MHRILITFLRSNWPTALTSAGSIAFMFLLAAGFGFITPQQKIDHLQAQMVVRDSIVAALDVKTQADFVHLDAKHQAEIDTLSRKLNRVDLLLSAIARGQCLDRPPREWKLMGLDCTKLLRQMGNADN